MKMDKDLARNLLIDAGIPEDQIDTNAINIASAVGDAIAGVVARKMAERLIESELPEMLKDFDACRARWAAMGITIH